MYSHACCPWAAIKRFNVSPALSGFLEQLPWVLSGGSANKLHRLWLRMVFTYSLALFAPSGFRGRGGSDLGLVGQPCVHADLIVKRVWEEVERIIYDPQTILERLEERDSDNAMSDINAQLEFVDGQLKRLFREQDKVEP
jgi:hypothetical protein